jgi:hypothetical protein
MEFDRIPFDYNTVADFNTNSTTTQPADAVGDNAQVVQDQELVISVPRDVTKQSQPDVSDFARWLTHPVKVNHLAWSASTSTSNITKDLLAYFYSLLPSGLAGKFSTLYFFKSKIRVRIVVQGAPFAFGQLVYSFTPYTKTPLAASGTPYSQVVPLSMVNCKIVPHLTIDPSSSRTYQIDLPVCTPNGWFTFATTYNHGSYNVDQIVFNSIASGTAVEPTVNVCMYVSLVDPEFQGITTLLSNDFVKEKKSDFIPSQAANYASEVANDASTVFPKLAPHLSLFSKVASGIGSVLSWFGFSKPPSTEHSTFILNRTCDNYSQSDGVSTAVVLGKSQTQALGIDPSLGFGELEDMSLDHLMAKRGYFTTVSVSTSTAAESSLGNWYVAPCVNVYSDGSGYIHPSPLAGVVNVFDYWCGDMDFEFEFVASVFHRATFLIAWDPYASNTTYPTFANALTVLNNTTIDISGNSSVRVTIPYKQPMPMLTNEQDLGIPPNHFNGVLYLFLVNPVTSNGSTDPIYVNMYVSSTNMRVAIPNMSGLESGTVVTQLLSHDVVSAEMPSGDGFCPQTSVSFGRRTDFTDLCLRVFGDLPRTIKDVTSRMVVPFIYSFSATTLYPAAYVSVPTVPNFPASVTNSTNPTFTFMNYFAPAFLGARGGKRLSVSWAETSTTASLETYAPSDFAVLNDTVAVPYSYGQYATRINGSPAYATTYVNTNISSRVDVVTPMLYPMNFYPTRCVFGSIPCAKFIHNYKFTGPSVYFDILEGTADDFVYTWFLGFPPVTY